jgi:predicted small lipoprotein YifL
MSNVRQILVSAIGLALVGVGLTACGQKGPLYIPTEPAAKDRATLPQVLTPSRSSNGAAPASAQPPAGAGNAPESTGGAK